MRMRLRAIDSLMLILLIVLLAGCGGGIEPVLNETVQEGRSPIGIGTYYPADAQTLASVVDGFLEDARESDEEGAIRMLMVPHSSYVFSGSIMADGYNQLTDGYDRVIILTEAKLEFDGVSIPSEDYRTPLGLVELDREAITSLLEVPFFSEGNDPDTRIEVQLPFLQRAIGNFTLIPLLVGNMGVTRMNKLSDELQELSDEDTLIIVANGLSKDLNYLNTYERDTPCLTAINQLDVNALINCRMTSYFSMLTAMSYAKALELDPDTITYKTSGDTAGNKDRVEGYAAVAFREAE